MKKIAAVESFFSPEHRVTLEKTAAECGFDGKSITLQYEEA